MICCKMPFLTSFHLENTRPLFSLVFSAQLTSYLIKTYFYSPLIHNYLVSVSKNFQIPADYHIWCAVAVVCSSQNLCNARFFKAAIDMISHSFLLVVEIYRNQKSRIAGLVLEFEMWRHFETKIVYFVSLCLIVFVCMVYPDPKFLISI